MQKHIHKRILVLAMVMLITGGCATDSTKPNSVTLNHSASNCVVQKDQIDDTVDLDAIYASAVEVHAATRSGLRRFGTGFAAAYDDDVCLIVTARHTIKDASEINITNPGNQSVRATLASEDIAGDIALLLAKESAEKCKPIQLRSVFKNTDFDEVLIFGNLDNQGISATHGIVSRIKKFGQGVLVETDAMAGPGSSGAPLVDRKGTAIGMIVQVGMEKTTHASHGRFSYALPAKAISIFLERFFNQKGNQQ